jgi:hypothetical protein
MKKSGNKPQSIIPIGKMVITVSVVTMCLMSAYELLKQLVIPDISIWESHTVTIIFTTVISTSASYFVLNKFRKLYRLLSGMHRICCVCKKVKDKNGRWIQIDDYLHAHSDASFTHGYCPDCFADLSGKISDG